jgi:glyoxylase-like metal-dependent hydrolase (beta-lactamase superfamily II)
MSANVQSFFHAPTNTWSHVVSDPATRVAAIIDPVLDFDPASGRVWSEQAQLLLDHVGAQALDVRWILETHAHADHLSSAAWLKQKIMHLRPGAVPQIGIGRGITGVQRHFRDVFGLGDTFAADGTQFDRLLDDGECMSLGELQLQAIATPGHTSDGMSYLIADAVFVGDTLFAPQAGTGRCDFPGADAATQYRSIRRLYALPDTTRVFLCHDYPPAGTAPMSETTIAAEKAANIQLRGDTTETEYVAFRHKRDASLAVPRLLYPSLQVNIRAGRLPDADRDGRILLQLPVRAEI